MTNSTWQAHPSKIHDKLDALTKSLRSKTITWLLNVDATWTQAWSPDPLATTTAEGGSISGNLTDFNIALRRQRRWILRITLPSSGSDTSFGWARAGGRFFSISSPKSRKLDSVERLLSKLNIEVKKLEGTDQLVKVVKHVRNYHPAVYKKSFEHFKKVGQVGSQVFIIRGIMDPVLFREIPKEDLSTEAFVCPYCEKGFQMLPSRHLIVIYQCHHQLMDCERKPKKKIGLKQFAVDQSKSPHGRQLFRYLNRRMHYTRK